MRSIVISMSVCLSVCLFACVITPLFTEFYVLAKRGLERIDRIRNDLFVSSGWPSSSTCGMSDYVMFGQD